MDELKFWTTINPAVIAADAVVAADFPKNQSFYGYCDYIVKNWDSIQASLKRAKEKQKEDEIKARHKTNEYFRSLVKHVHWSGNTCIVYWKDGTQTKSRWDTAEEFDPEKAILVCMARKLYGGTGIYNEVLEKYAEDGWTFFEKNFLEDWEDSDEYYV